MADNLLMPIDAETLRCHMEHQRVKLIDIIDSEYGLLNICLEQRVLSISEIGRIKAKASSYEKNEQLLLFIANNEKEEDFLTALKESSQTHVANWIIADGKFRDEFGLDWPLTNEENEALDRNQRTLVDFLDTCDLLNRLYSKDVINKWQKEFIEVKQTSHDKNEALLEIVRRLSRKGYSIVINCLRDSIQGHVADILEFGGAIVPVHATLESDNLDELETQIVNRMADELCSNTKSMGHANRLLAALQLQVIAVKRGESIVLYVKCCKEEEFYNLRKVVETMELKEALEELFNLLLQNTTVKVLVVKIFETDLAKAKETFALHMAEQKAATVEMASSGNEAMKRLRALSECCICLTTYTDPRMLTCFHTACLKCFEDIQLKNGKKPGDGLPCPLCRNEFIIPPDGMKGLQRNYFIESVIEVTKAFNIENKPSSCTMCSKINDVNDVAEATMRCLNCCANYCLQCSKIHKTLKATKDHKIVELNTEVNEKEIRNMFPIRKCVRHSDKVLDYYCSDCKTVVCVSCFVEKHKRHKCKDVTTVDKEFRQRIEQIFTEMNDSKGKMLSRKRELENKKVNLLTKVLKTERAIRKKNQQLKALIDQHTEELLKELSLLKQQQEKKMNAEIEDSERKLTVQESFVAFCTELKSKGSPSEVCGSVDSLIERANELKKENDEYLREPSKSFDFEFIATDHSAGNVIGKLSEFVPQLESCAFVMSANTGDSMASNVIKIDLNRPEDVSKIEPIPTRVPFGVAAVVNCDSIFVTGTGENWNEIWKFDSASSKWMKRASLVQGRQLHMVAFVANVLFICGGNAKPSRKALDDVESYDGRNDKCVSVGKLVHAVRNSGNCVPFKNSLYIFGGCDENHQIVRNVQVYNTELNSCTLLATLIPRDACLLRAVRWENTAILLGLSTCLVYRFDTGTWQVNDQFTAGNVHFGLALNKDKLFVIGGGLHAYALKNTVKWIPVANVLNDEPSEWRHHAYLPKSSSVYEFVCGEME